MSYPARAEGLVNSTIRSNQGEFRLITKVNHIPLFLCPHDMLCVEVQTNLLIFLRNQRSATWNPSHNFPLFNLQETVFLEIGFHVCSQNTREIDVAVSKRSFKDILTIILSSRLVVIRGLPVIGFGSSVLSALNLLITR